MCRVKMNVSGTHFEFDRIILDKTCQRLAKMCDEASGSGKPLEFTVDRSALSFGAILSYYQTGELHIPPGVCPGAFRRELEFWEVEFDAIYECCLYRYQAFLDSEETRRTFLHSTLVTNAMASPIVVSSPVVGNLHTYISRLWRIIDNNEKSLPAKLYFILVFIMVLLSIFVLAYSTEPSMRRRVSKCELLEYMASIEDRHLPKVREILGYPECSHGGFWGPPTDKLDIDHGVVDLDNYDWSYLEYSWEDVMDWIGDNVDNSSDPTSNTGKGVPPNPLPPAPTNSSSTMAISSSTTETPSSSTAEQPSTDTEDPALLGPPIRPHVEMKIEIPHLTVPVFAFDVLDSIINFFFTIDFIMRLISCPSVRRYFLSSINIFDALALLACYTFLIIVTVKKEYRYSEPPWLFLLQFSQVFRALRLFRVVKNVRASQVLAYSLTQDLRDMTLLVMLLFVGISSFACLFYFAESRETILSIPNAWYWAIITMTTVGYGDISPQTGIGRVIASICAICGVLLLAITLPMFVNNFLTLYQYSCVNDSIKKQKNDKNKAVEKTNTANDKEHIDDIKMEKFDTSRHDSTIFHVKPALEVDRIVLKDLTQTH